MRIRNLTINLSSETESFSELSQWIDMSLLQDVGIYCREGVAGISNRDDLSRKC